MAKLPPTTIRLTEEQYNVVKQYADEKGLSITDGITSMIDDGIGFFAPKIKALEESNKTLVENEQRQTAEIERLTRLVEELTENEKRQTAALNELIETLTGEKDALTVAHGEKENALNHLSGNHLNVYFTPRQQQVLQKVFEFRANDDDTAKTDEYAATVEQMVYVWVADILKNDKWSKPKGYIYEKIFPDLKNRPKSENVATALVLTEEPQAGPYDITIPFTKEQYEAIAEVCEWRKENEVQGKKTNLVHTVYEAVELGLLAEDFQEFFDEDEIGEIFEGYPPALKTQNNNEPETVESEPDDDDNDTDFDDEGPADE